MADLVNPNAYVPGTNYTYAQLAAMQMQRTAAMQNMPTMPTIQMPAPATGVQNSTQSKFINIQASTGAAGGKLILGGFTYFGTAKGSQANFTINVNEFDSANITESDFTTNSDAILLAQAIAFNPINIKSLTINGATTATQQNQKSTLKSTKLNAEFTDSALISIQNFQPLLSQNQYQAPVVVYSWGNGVLVDALTYLVLPIDANLNLTISIEYVAMYDLTTPSSLAAFVNSANTTKQGSGSQCILG
jgi:hypothetical protein